MSDSLITQHYFFHEPAAGSPDEVKVRLRIWGIGRVGQGEQWSEVDTWQQFFRWTVPGEEGRSDVGAEYTISVERLRPEWAWDNASRVADVGAAWAVHGAGFAVQVDGNLIEDGDSDAQSGLLDGIELLTAELLRPGVILVEFGRVQLPKGVEPPAPPEWFVTEHALRTGKL